MKKNLIIALALVFVLGIAGTAFAAPNPFVDVPAKHWAYDAVNTLVKNKVVDGYGDGTFRGDRTMTRYEMAQIVAKAVARSDKANAESKAAIDKLQVEFAAELQNLGVRVDKLEKNVGTVKFSGDARIRYVKNFNLAGTNATNSVSTPARFQERVRLTAQSKIDDNWSFNARFGAQNTNDNNAWNYNNRQSNNGNTYFDRMEFKFVPTNSKNWAFTVGRSTLFLGQGMLYDYAIDAFTAGYTGDKFRAKLWIGDTSPTNNLWGDVGGATARVGSQNVVIGEVGYQFDKNFGMTTTYIKNISDAYPFKVWGVSAKAKLGPDFTLLGEYAKNSYDFGAADAQAQKRAYWYELAYKGSDVTKPGTWGLAVRYINAGKDSFDMNATTWNYASQANGLKGYEVNFNYAFAKGANINLGWGKYKPYDTNFTTTFDSYNTAYHAITTFAF